MTKQILTKKLSLCKKTVANLEKKELRHAKGGIEYTDGTTCISIFINCETNEKCSCAITMCTH
jgi:hypothetical protein